jgi:glutamine synthetase
VSFELEKVTNGKLSPEEKTELKLNVVGKIPEILLDNTDRNRTSPLHLQEINLKSER